MLMYVIGILFRIDLIWTIYYAYLFFFFYKDYLLRLISSSKCREAFTWQHKVLVFWE